MELVIKIINFNFYLVISFNNLPDTLQRLTIILLTTYPHKITKLPKSLIYFKTNIMKNKLLKIKKLILTQNIFIHNIIIFFLLFLLHTREFTL